MTFIIYKMDLNQYLKLSRSQSGCKLEFVRLWPARRRRPVLLKPPDWRLLIMVGTFHQRQDWEQDPIMAAKPF